MPKIVYLEAQGNGTFRSGLRSDTLWGILCWTIRMLQDAKSGQVDDVGILVKDYLKDTDREHAFYLSSAFPWVETNGEKTHFLPSPLIEPEKTIKENNKTVQEKKKAIRQDKNAQEKAKGYITWQEFDHRFGSGKNHGENNFKYLEINSQAITHNQIDRRRLGTFTENDSGQLFHMNENYLGWDKDTTVDKHGFYFLLDGHTNMVEPALRLMETMGIAGDSSVGKGHFKITVEKDVHDLSEGFSLPKIDDTEANTALCLSLYNPANILELSAFEKKSEQETSLWQYKLEDRQGRNVYNSELFQDGQLLFKEGSVFPKIAGSSNYPGKNWEAGKHSLGHTIYRYGHAFMLNMKLK